MKTISIITVCFNSKVELERTINSVISQNFDDKEYIVVDGGSTDGTLDVIQSHRNDIDVVISEPDKGIYDAMNKGIAMAQGEWIICMNSGDEFASSDILQRVFSRLLPDDICFLYSDYQQRTLTGDIMVKRTDRHKGEVFHQSSIYRKSLHSRYGLYVVTHPYIVSDLLFFLSVPEEKFLKLDFEISLSDYSGVSQGLWCREQALCLRAVFGQESINSAFSKYWISRLKRLIPMKLRERPKALKPNKDK